MQKKNQKKLFVFEINASIDYLMSLVRMKKINIVLCEPTMLETYPCLCYMNPAFRTCKLGSDGNPLRDQKVLIQSPPVFVYHMK